MIRNKKTNSSLFFLFFDLYQFDSTVRLFNACEVGNEDEVIMLLRAGVEVNSRSAKEQTPLHIAAKFNQTRVMIHLLRVGSKFEILPILYR